MARSFYERQALTRAAPSGTPGNDSTSGQPIGMSTHNLRGLRVVIEAPAGCTLAGNGTLDCYLYHPVSQLWIRNPDLDINVTETGRAQAFPDQECFADAEGRILYAANSVGISGTPTTPSEANTVMVRIDGGDPR